MSDLHDRPARFLGAKLPLLCPVLIDDFDHWAAANARPVNLLSNLSRKHQSPACQRGDPAFLHTHLRLENALAGIGCPSAARIISRVHPAQHL